MNLEEIITKTNYFLVEEFEVDEDKILPEANLIETLDLDSLDYVDLVVSIQNTFNVKVGEADFKSLETINDFYNMIANKVNS